MTDETKLEAGSVHNSINLARTDITEFPADVTAKIRLDLNDCRHLTKLPDGIETGSLILRDCTALEHLPNGIDVTFLDLEGCSSLRALPDDLTLRGGGLNLSGCVWLDKLPADMGEVSYLDVSKCLNITMLPRGLKVTSWVDIAGSGIDIDTLPEEYDDVGFRWHGVSIPDRIVRAPETLSTDEILNEPNAEVRRVMMERFGYERLFEEAKAEILDKDTDPGGERRLMRIPFEGDEDLVCVYVQCPSTAHKFVLRVPPSMKTCHQAIAWTAGFDNPDLYKPLVET